MGNTISTSNLRKTLWDKELLREAISEMWFKQFMSTDKKSPIILKTDFKKENGDNMYVGLRMKLTGEGVDGDDEMEGNEEELSVYDQNFKVNQKRNAVRLKGRMDEQRAAYNLRSEAKDAVGTWLSEIMEKEIFRKAGGLTAFTFANTPTVPSTTAGNTRIMFGGDATTDSDIDNTDKLTLAVIFKAKAKAQTCTPKLQPIRYKGRDYYVLLIHPRQKFDLISDSNYTQFMREAEVRGAENPLISGADAVVDNVIIHVHEYVPTFSNFGSTSNLPGARALFLGAQAVVLGIGGTGAGWYEKEFDMGNKWAIAAGRIFGCQKTKFNSNDFGVIAIDTYATSI